MFLILFDSDVHVVAETCVVKTKYLLSWRDLRIMSAQDVFAPDHSQEGR
jgi:hypothetical protein